MLDTHDRCRRAIELVCLFAVALWLCGSLHAAERAHPNVLLIMTDDQGFGDVTSHGNKWIKTPVHDRIAAEGARFDRFYVSPVCAPTRASLLTGRYHLRTGVWGVTRAAETMRSNEVTIAEILKANGYATGIFGKWHNGAHYPQHPNGQGFDEFVGFCAGHWNNYFDTGLERNGEPIKSSGFIIDYLTDRAISFIEGNRDKPWLCYVPYNTPHTPWQVPDKYWNRYKDVDGLSVEEKCAYAMCENIDDNMGRLLDTLDRLDLDSDTIVIFLTDNGANTDRYDAHMRGRKGSLHEGGTRVPLFIRWPGRVKPGVVVEPITAHVDLLPTLVEMTGVKMIDTLPLDGRSLVPLMRGETKDWPSRTLFTHWGFRNDTVRTDRGAVRTQRWRAVRYGKWMLFDMRADPSEKKDLAKTHPDVLKELVAAYDAWFKDVTGAGFDPVPAEIGHAPMPTVTLPGHEALFAPGNGKGISYHGKHGWANDYVDHWTDTDARPTWPVRVVHAGRYDVTVHYKCEADVVGTKLRVAVGDAHVDGVISKAHDPEPVPTPDRIGRKEALEYVWMPLRLGVIDLPAGDATLSIKLLSKPGAKGPQIKDVRLKRLD